jgi:secreted trypsin-like serine protease
MKYNSNLRERYIQLVENFITALESGTSWAELQDIKNEIRIISVQLNSSPNVENHTQQFDFLPLNQRNNNFGIEG